MSWDMVSTKSWNRTPLAHHHQPTCTEDISTNIPHKSKGQTRETNKPT